MSKFSPSSPLQNETGGQLRPKFLTTHALGQGGQGRRRGITLIEVVVVIAIIVVVAMFGLLIWAEATDPIKVGRYVHIRPIDKPGVILEDYGRTVLVNYVDDYGNISAAQVLRSQVQPLEGQGSQR